MKNKSECTKLQLEEHIRYFTPKGWIGPIHEFTFIPLITDEEFDVICKGALPNDQRFKPWYIQEAIKTWLNKNLTNI